MPPFLLPVLAVGAVAVAAAVYALSTQVRHKSVLVLGPRRSGKTTLKNAILGAQLKSFVLDGRMTAKVAWEHRTFESEHLRVDVGDTLGGVDALTESLQQLEQTPDLVIFVVAADQLSRPEYVRHCESMATSIVAWSPHQRRALVVTHADLVLDHERPSLSDLEIIDVGDLAKLLDVESFLLCNLTLDQSRTFVVGRLIKELTR